MTQSSAESSEWKLHSIVNGCMWNLSVLIGTYGGSTRVDWVLLLWNLHSIRPIRMQQVWQSRVKWFRIEIECLYTPEHRYCECIVHFTCSTVNPLITVHCRALYHNYCELGFISVYVYWEQVYLSNPATLHCGLWVFWRGHHSLKHCVWTSQLMAEAGLLVKMKSTGVPNPRRI